MNHNIDEVELGSGMLEGDMIVASKRKRVSHVRIIDATNGYGLAATLRGSDDEHIIVTSRDRTKPRYYKDIRLLIKMLKENFKPEIISIDFTDAPADKATPRKKVKKRATRKKASSRK